MILKQRAFLKDRNNLFQQIVSLFLISASLQFPVSGCTPRQILRSVKPLLTLGYGKAEAIQVGRFKLLDDFSSRDFKNRVGGTWTTQPSEGSSASIRYAEEEAISRYGYALEVKYDLAKKGRAAIRADLNGLDISKAQALSLWLAFTAHRNSTLKIRLTSASGVSREVDMTRRLSPASKKWQEVLIPAGKWLGVDFNHLKSLELVIESAEAEDGSLLLDQLSFFGPPDVFFESLKDNLVGFPRRDRIDQEALLALGDEALLRRIAGDTWRYFANTLDRRTSLPLDRIKLSLAREIGDYVSPTDIGLYWVAAICASELGLISRLDALLRIRRSLKTVEKLPKWKGFLYNYYSTTNLGVTRRFASTVDNGWFAASLIVVKAAFPVELGRRVEKILSKMDFGDFYEMGEGKLSLGYDDQAKKLSASHYGLLATEARLASFVAIVKGDVEPEHWFRMQRVFPKSWAWQKQVPAEAVTTYRGIRVTEGYYVYLGRKIVPSWGGSLFEFLMPTLILNEQKLARRSLGENNRIAAEIHRDYALSTKRYPVWGISPCMVDRGPRSVYLELGVSEIGAKGYRDGGVIAPYASFLALEILPEDVMVNIRRLLNLYPIYGEYGFYDSVAVRKPLVTRQYLALDQAMILIAIANYLKKGVIREKFHSLMEVRRAESLLGEERFFES